jgi:hypothetical protein
MKTTKTMRSGRRLAGCAAVLVLCGAVLSGCTKRDLEQEPEVEPPAKKGAIVMRTAAAENEKPFEAGKAAAEALKAAMGGTAPHAVVMVDCFDEADMKKEALRGVASVFDKGIILGGATYGSFTQAGSLDLDAVSLLGIGGDGVSVTTALEKDMGATGLSLETQKEKLAKCLSDAGARLARKLPGAAEGSLMILIADAHSPKNQFLIDGVQAVVGKKLPITGGSISKNAGQTYVYYAGDIYKDSAVALVIAGDLKVSQTGRQAKTNDMVISTAKEGSAAALEGLGAKPFAMIAFDCAGRMGKLDNLGDELAAIQSSVGKEVPIFGCYCAGEFGPADAADIADKKICYGRGWHVMTTLLGR